MMSYQPPALPDKAVLPKNSAEQKIWAYSIVMVGLRVYSKALIYLR